MLKKYVFGLLFCAITAAFVFSYDVVLKNGKTIKGTLLSEDQATIMMKDPSGLHITLKKTNVDLEKTAAANRPVEKPASPEEKPAEKKTEGPESEKLKKPAKVYTEGDIYRLRSSNPLKGPSSAVKKSEDQDQQTEEKGEDYWRNTSAGLLNEMQAAQQAYNELNDGCQRLKGATIQTHVVVNEKGETMDMAETAQDFCQRAEDAKGQYEQVKSEYESFMEEARQESVPPGWLASED